MKRCFLFLGLLSASPLSAACPSGYGELEIGSLYSVVETACPAGYGEWTESKLILPSGGICDASKGVCSAAGVCRVP